MKHTDYQSVPLEKFAGDGASGTGVRWLVGERDGAENFAMRMIEVEPGGHSPCHAHPGEHEVFVWRGSGELMIDGKNYILKPGTAAFVPEGIEHQFRNTGDENLEFICVIPLGK
jgi:quercetin dioxygenase-like cupin family protein